MAYKFNDSLICVNPDREVMMDNKRFFIELRYAFAEGFGWCLGFKFNQYFGDSSGLSCLPGCNKYRKPYNSKEEARMVGIAKMIETFPDQEEIIKLAEHSKQLTLF